MTKLYSKLPVPKVDDTIPGATGTMLLVVVASGAITGHRSYFAYLKKVDFQRSAKRLSFFI